MTNRALFWAGKGRGLLYNFHKMHKRRRAGDGVQPRRQKRGAEGRRDGSRRRERGAEGRRDGGAAAHAASYGRRRRGGAAAGCSGTAAAAHAGRKEAAGKQC